MSGADKRLDRRFDVEIPADVQWGKQKVRLTVSDVSAHGLFLMTEAPPPHRHLVQLKMTIPTSDEELRLNGLAVHIVPVNDKRGRPPGFGIQFFAFDSTTRSLWTKFIRAVEADADSGRPSTLLRAAAPATPPPPNSEIRIGSLEMPAVVPPAPPVELRPRHEKDLERMRGLLETRGHALLRTARPFALGAPVRVNVIHPETRCVFPANATAVRPPQPIGASEVYVRFDEPTPAQLDDYDVFVSSGIPVLDEENSGLFEIDALKKAASYS